MVENVGQIKNEILAKKESTAAQANFDSQIAGLGNLPTFEPRMQDINYDVRMGDVYDVNNEGLATPKFKDYYGATGNEDRLAQEQSSWDKIANGLTKSVAKTGIYAADSINMFTYGLYSAVKDGKMSSLWDNSVSNVLDDYAKDLDRELPNYYNAEEQSNNFLENLGTVNFWANDFTGGMAFVAGALLPEAALGYFTGGYSVGASIGKWSARAGASLTKAHSRKLGMAALREGARYGRTAGELINTGRFVAQTTFFEAGMEARHNFHDNVENFGNEFYAENGRIPTTEELGKYMEGAKASSDAVFLSNAALLSVTNAAMFGKAFGLSGFKNPLSKEFNKALGLGVTTGEKGTLAALNPTKLQKVLGNAYYIGRKPLSEGIIEEGGQGVISKISTQYADSKYKDDSSFQFMSSLGEAIQEQYATKEGWKEIGIGMLVGALGGNVGGNFGIEGVIGNTETYGKTRKNIANTIETSNKFNNSFRNMNRANSVMNTQEDGTEATLYQDTVSSYNYIMANRSLMDYTDLEANYDTMVDSLDISEDQMQEIGFKGDMETYKAKLKTDFRKDYDSYSKARDLVEDLGIPSKVELTKGQYLELGDSLTATFMMAERSSQESGAIAENIESVVGETGLYSAMKFIADMNTTQEASVARLETEKENQARLQEEIVNIQSQIETAKAGTTEDSTQRAKELSKKYVVATQQMAKLEKNRQVIETSLNEQVKSLNTGLSLEGNPTFENIDTVLEKVNSVRAYVDALGKAGKTKEAAELNRKIDQFDIMVGAQLEGENTIRRMMSSNYFSSNEGKGLLSSILGSEYTPSEEFLKELRENETQVLEIFNRLGMPVGSVDELVNDYIKANPEVSEREKFKVESVLRTILAAGRVQGTVDVLTRDYVTNLTAIEEVGTMTDTSITAPNIKGDTVNLLITTEAREVTNVETLSKLINEIGMQIDSLTSKPTAEALDEINGLRQRLNTLNEELNTLKSSTDEPLSQQSTAEISVGEQPQNSQGISEGNPQEQEITQQGEATEEEITSQIQPPTTELSVEEKETLVDSIFDETDFITDNIQLLEEALQEELQRETVDEPYVSQLEFEIQNLRNEQADGRNNVTVDDGTAVGPNERAAQGETVANIEQAPDFVEQPTFDKAARTQEIEGEIAEIEKEITELEKPFQFTDSPTYRKYQTLLTKEASDTPLTDEEQILKEQYRRDIDNWMWIMGIETGGFSFSDLITQLVTLKTTPIENVVATEEFSEAQLDRDLAAVDKNNQQNLTTGLNFNAVTSIRKEVDGVVYTQVSNISPEELSLSSGINVMSLEGVYMVPVTRAIMLPQAAVESINSAGRVNISNAATEAGSRYNIVTTVITNLDGSQFFIPMESDYEKEYQEAMVDDGAVYETRNGQSVRIAIDPNDPWNQALLQRVAQETGARRKPTEKEIEEETAVMLAETMRTDGTITRLQQTVMSGKTREIRDRASEKLFDRVNVMKERIREKLSRSPKTGRKISQTLKDSLNKGLKIMVTDPQGRNISVMKGLREVGMSEAKALKQLEAFRAVYANDIDLLVDLVETGIPFEAESVLKVEKVYMGHPNFNLQGDGSTMLRVSKPITAEMVDNISDTGYIQNGKVFARGDASKIDQTFIQSQINNKTSKKIPIVVLNVGGRRIAWPVRVAQETVPVDIAQMTDIFNSELTPTEKANKLNPIMAQAGIDIKIPGNAFMVVQNNNLSPEFFQQKVAQIQNNVYLRSVDDFIDKKKTLQEILLNNASININLSRPFISPKIKFDMSGVQVTMENDGKKEKSKSDSLHKVSNLKRDVCE